MYFENEKRPAEKRKFDKPIYSDDKLGGLTIALNDIWATEVILTDYELMLITRLIRGNMQLLYGIISSLICLIWKNYRILSHPWEKLLCVGLYFNI